MNRESATRVRDARVGRRGDYELGYPVSSRPESVERTNERTNETRRDDRTPAHSFNRSIDRSHHSIMGSSARARATVIEGRGPAFVNPGATIEICGATTGPSETVERTRRGWTTTSTTTTTTRVAAWSEELDEVELDAGESFAMVLVARDAEGGELGRGSIDVKALRDANGRYARGGCVPGRWCDVVDARGERRGTVCVRVKVTATGREGEEEEEEEDLEREYRERRRPSTEGEGEDGETTTAAAAWRGAAGSVNVAGKWLSGVIARRGLDEEAREEIEERKRREREAAEEEKRARKERERIEREEARAAEEERRAQKERERVEREEARAAAAEEKRARKERERIEREEARAAEAERAAKMESLRREAKEQWESEKEGEKRRHEMSENEAAGSRGKFHMPNVEEIKHTLAEGAHHVGSVAHRVGDAVKEKGDKFVHSVSDQVHHVGDKIRETNDRMGKALAKKQWVRDVASRLSPNSVLVVAIAVFLAGLPENREAAARKAQSMKKKLRQSRSTATEASKHSYNESAARDEGYADVVYNADDVEDDAAYIGRGPTPRGVYEVIEGDTLCSIAGCFNLDVVEIIDKNGDVIKNPDELAPGDRIRIY